MKQLSVIYLLAAAFITMPLVASACEMHSNLMFGTFGAGHPLMQRHIQRAEPEPITLEMSESVVTAIDSPSILDINFILPGDYKDVSLLFTASKGLSLDAVHSGKLNVSKGVYELNYQVSTPGQHHIEVTAKARLNGYPYLYVQRVYVNTPG